MQSALNYPTISCTFNEKPRNQQAAFIRGFTLLLLNIRSVKDRDKRKCVTYLSTHLKLIAGTSHSTKLRTVFITKVQRVNKIQQNKLLA